MRRGTGRFEDGCILMSVRDCDTRWRLRLKSAGGIVSGL